MIPKYKVGNVRGGWWSVWSDGEKVDNEGSFQAKGAKPIGACKAHAWASHVSWSEHGCARAKAQRKGLVFVLISFHIANFLLYYCFHKRSSKLQEDGNLTHTNMGSWDSKLRPLQVKALFHWARPVVMLCNLFDITCLFFFLKEKKKDISCHEIFQFGVVEVSLCVEI